MESKINNIHLSPLKVSLSPSELIESILDSYNFKPPYSELHLTKGHLGHQQLTSPEYTNQVVKRA